MKYILLHRIDNPSIDTNIGYLEILSSLDLNRNHSGKVSEEIRSKKTIVQLDRLVELALMTYGITVKNGEVRESRIRMKGNRIRDDLIYREKFGPGAELGYYHSSVHYGPISWDDTKKIFL
jgi:hypothetical protein